jgi:valyl-tRNA synthetase
MKLPKVYEPDQYEKDIYALWEKSGAFVPKERGSKETFSMVAPPPNANGNLHLGHALTNAIQDILARYHRMKGEASLYLPGADHAGFETWVVYEKKLNAEGKTRFDYSREELYQQVWDFVQLNKKNFEDQYRALGASFDWTRLTFTLDQKVVDRAYATFKKMWGEKLIYRGERLVNFCTYHGTSFSDIEVQYKEEASKLWHIKYPLTDGSSSITVATTRPETMLGDTAVAVNPKDARYKQFLGKTIKLPLTQREIPILADEMVDKDFGTGAVKITPAHDPNDYEVAQRHDLPMITVISHEGAMTHDVPGPYRTLSVEKARELVVADLKDLGLLAKEEDYTHSVGHCYKCDTIIQPLLREQWFVDMKPLAAKAIKALESREITFYPAAKRDQAIAYLKNIRDWNISRQIAWGIPIPAFQNVEDPDDWIYDERVSKEIIEIKGKTYRRDPDVFDTWFSSGQWPYTTLDYPDGEDFKQFYPLSLMETGFDILYQWVCRMIMLGLYITDSVPFRDVYLHGLVLIDGQKMSKSKGNVINPMDAVKQYGSDALRMGLITGQTPGVNQPFGPPKVVAARNFCNKLWNVARFIEDQVGNDAKLSEPDIQTPADAWILRKLQRSVGEVTQFLDQYRFSEAYELIYHLLWDDFADWYIEASKKHLNPSVLAYGLQTILQLAHPFAPFVTETIWQTLKREGDSLLITSKWPEPVKSDDKKAAEFEEIKQIVSELRFIKGVMHLRSGPAMYHAGDPFIAQHAQLIKALTRVSDITEVKDGQGLHLTSTAHRVWLDIDQETANHFVTELMSQIEAQDKLIKSLEGRLSNKAYVQNAPKQIVDQTKQQLQEAQATLTKVREEHNRFAPSVK